MAKKSTEKQDKSNGNLRHWKPGQSGNPKGRPKKGFAVSERARAYLAEEDKYSKEAISNLDSIIRTAGEKAKRGDHYSRVFLFEWAFGKVPDKLITYEADDKDELIIE